MCNSLAILEAILLLSSGILINDVKGISFDEEVALLSNITNKFAPDTPQEQILAKHEPLDTAESFAAFLYEDSLLEDSNETQGTAATASASSHVSHQADDYQGSGQVVFLKFENGGSFDPIIVDEATDTPIPDLTLFDYLGIEPIPNYEFTEADKEFIIGKLRDDFAPFNFTFVTTEPTNGTHYSTLTFNDNDNTRNGGPGIVYFAQVNETDGSLSFTSMSIIFGLADGIDFLNRNHSDNAGIDASYWTFLHYLDSSGDLLSARSGIPMEGNIGADDIWRFAVITQSANTAAHELGHLLGLRHHDSFGPIGSGLPHTGLPDPLKFVPVYTGAKDADESILHILASGASVGLPMSLATNFDRFFSERSAIKIALSEEEEGSKLLRSEEEIVRQMQNEGPVRPKRLRFPNTVEFGNNAGDDDDLEVDAIVIRGRIGSDGELDTYEFEMRSGHRIFNAEIISFAGLPPRSDRVISRLRLIRKTTVTDSSGMVTITRTEVALNYQIFEGLDPFILDAEILPPEDNTTTTYILEVGAPDLYFYGGNVFSFKAHGFDSFLTGDYDLLVYSARRRISDESREEHKQNQQGNNHNNSR